MRKEKGKKITAGFAWLLLDRLSKILSVKHGLSSLNKGVSFGLLLNCDIIILLSVLGLIACLFFFKKKFNQFGAWLIIIGGASNLVDRIVYGGVVDFVYIPPFPAFNFADIGICAGVVLLLVDLVSKKTLS